MWISKFEFQIYLQYRPMFTNSQEMFVCLFVCFSTIDQVGKDKLLLPSFILKDGYFSQSSLSSWYSLLKFTVFCGAPNDNSPPCMGTDSQSWSYNYRIK